MAGHGGARPGAGRPKGSRDAVTKEQQATIGEMARALAPIALKALKEVAETGSDSARVAAANSILDRAYGKPLQAAGDGEEDGASSLIVNIRSAAPVGEIRVTRTDG